jgi:hypothetical protein
VIEPNLLFGDGGSLANYLLGLASNCDLLISASQVARIIEVSHQHPPHLFFLLLLFFPPQITKLGMGQMSSVVLDPRGVEVDLVLPLGSNLVFSSGLFSG